MKIINICLFLSALFIGNTFGQQNLPYKNPTSPVEERVKDLLARMTLEEKFWQLFMIPGDVEKGDEEKYKHGIFGFQISAAPKEGNAGQQMLNYNTSEDALSVARKINKAQHYFIEQSRLGIPIIAFDEGLHGLVRGGATAFPQAIGLAASWDTALMHSVANAIAIESKSRGIRQILSPVINIASDVRWGRTEETYGEDPFLTSEMGIAFISAFEKMNIITTPKHFIANVGDGGRDSYPINYNERQLDEIYLPPFEAVIKRGGARSIMTAYNSLNGMPSSANDWLLNKKLKGEWGFNGFAISDANAVGGSTVLLFTAKDYPTAGQQAISNGLDVIFQTEYDHYKLFIPPFLNGDINSKRIDDAVSRVLRAKFELGLFEHPYVNENDIFKWQNDKSHKAIAKQAALESIVLLKNEKFNSGKILPFSNTTKSIAVIGNDAIEARLGGYSSLGNEKVNILDGIKNRAGNKVKITYSSGVKRLDNEYKVVPEINLSHTIDGETTTGLKGEYFNNISLTGAPAITRNDATINFQWTLFGPDKLINNDFYSARWTGKIQSPKKDKYKIGLDGNDGYRLYLNNQLIIDNWKKESYDIITTEYLFEQNKSYDIRVEFYEPIGNAHIKLIWNVGVENDWKQQIKDAVATAQQADVAIIAAGIEEGEFRDRALLQLPGHQEEMIQAITAIGKPVVVLLVGGSAVTMNNWKDKVNAIVDVWYPGEDGGNAVAEVLFGDYSPSGRLPITFPISEAQLPLVYNHKPTGRGDDYNNLSGLPLFPFGFGLSYTQFEYSDLMIDKNNISTTDSTVIRFKIKNTGTVKSDEVVQLYIKDLLATVARPVMELKGFQRINLLPGETKEITFKIMQEMLGMLDEKLNKVVEPGDFRIMIGASSRDIRLKETLTIK